MMVKGLNPNTLMIQYLDLDIVFGNMLSLSRHRDHSEKASLRSGHIVPIQS